MAREIAGKDQREGEGEREDPGVWSWKSWAATGKPRSFIISGSFVFLVVVVRKRGKF